jgi:hypothetical protein
MSIHKEENFTSHEEWEDWEEVEPIRVPELSKSEIPKIAIEVIKANSVIKVTKTVKTPSEATLAKSITTTITPAIAKAPVVAKFKSLVDTKDFTIKEKVKKSTKDKENTEEKNSEKIIPEKLCQILEGPVQKMTVENVYLPDEEQGDQAVVVIRKNFGSGRFLAETPHGMAMLHQSRAVRGKLKSGDVVLASFRLFGSSFTDKRKLGKLLVADALHKYNTKEINFLRKRGIEVDFSQQDTGSSNIVFVQAEEESDESNESDESDDKEEQFVIGEFSCGRALPKEVKCDPTELPIMSVQEHEFCFEQLASTKTKKQKRRKEKEHLCPQFIDELYKRPCDKLIVELSKK